MAPVYRYHMLQVIEKQTDAVKVRCQPTNTKELESGLGKDAAGQFQWLTESSESWTTKCNDKRFSMVNNITELKACIGVSSPLVQTLSQHVPLTPPLRVLPITACCCRCACGIRCSWEACVPAACSLCLSASRSTDPTSSSQRIDTERVPK